MTRTKNGSKLYKVLSRLAPEEMKVKSSKFSNTKTPHYTTTLLLYIDLTCVTGNNNNKKTLPAKCGQDLPGFTR